MKRTARRARRPSARWCARRACSSPRARRSARARYTSITPKSTPSPRSRARCGCGTRTTAPRQRDGCPRPDMGTFALMLTDSSEMNGALYVVPGSHKRGRIEPYYDESTSYKFWAVPKRDVIEVLKHSPAPVPIVGPAGTCVLFHCNLLHASGHDLSAEDRWHIYISFNACANAPTFTEKSRPDWVVSRNTEPLPIEADTISIPYQVHNYSEA